MDAMSKKVDDVRTELTGKIDDVRTNLIGKIGAVKTELNDKMDAGFAFLQEQAVGTRTELNAMSSRVDGLHSRMTQLELGAFTEEEKKEMLSNIRHYNKGLRSDARGEKQITLTREEYNRLVEIGGLPNRSEKLQIA